MQMSVTDFKAKCTKVFRAVEKQKQSVEITRRGKIIAVVHPPEQSAINPENFLGSLKNTIKLNPGWDDPLGDDEWKACE